VIQDYIGIDQKHTDILQFVACEVGRRRKIWSVMPSYSVFLSSPTAPKVGSRTPLFSHRGLS